VDWFTLFVWGWIAVAVITLISLVSLKVRAPYGRHSNDLWGKSMDNHWGWFIMELPALLTFPLIVIMGPAEKSWLTWLLVGMWTLHYFNRTVIFPFRLKTTGKKIPLTIVFSAIFFNGMNGFVNGYFLGYINIPDDTLMYYAPNIIIGLLLYIIGTYINHSADTRLINLRAEDKGYQIPRGWLFNYISCPNHFGEIVEWFGFAIVAWSLPGLSFAIWTFCNLIPRTLNHHEWYYENFEDYPKKRKAVIPFIW
jgi:3-oxo-5-alpha-steroid 4-dehydrogenase 1